MDTVNQMCLSTLPGYAPRGTRDRAALARLTLAELDAALGEFIVKVFDKRVHPHGLRHTHAAELVAEGVPVNVIQKQLGHVSLATTDIYLRHIAPADVIAMGRNREWTP
jgi:integrase